MPLIYSWAAATSRHPADMFLREQYIGPLTFYPDDYTLPKYIPAKTSIMVIRLLAIAAILVSWGCCGGKIGRGIKRREMQEHEHVVNAEFMDRTDKENGEFRYFFGEYFWDKGKSKAGSSMFGFLAGSNLA